MNNVFGIVNKPRIDTRAFDIGNAYCITKKTIR